MNKIKANAVVDILLLVLGIITVVSGFFMWPVQGSFLGLTRVFWKDIHVFAGIIFALLLIFHIFLHWAWIKNIKQVLR